MCRAVYREEEGWSALKILTVNPIGKRPLGKPRRRQKYNIKIDIKLIDVNKRNSIDQAQNMDYWRPL